MLCFSPIIIFYFISCECDERELFYEMSSDLNPVASVFSLVIFSLFSLVVRGYAMS